MKPILQAAIALAFTTGAAYGQAIQQKPTTITLSVAEQQELFRNDGAFDSCMKHGGQRCVAIQNWLQGKIAEAQAKKEEK